MIKEEERRDESRRYFDISTKRTEPNPANRYFTQKQLLDGVRDRYPKTKYDTFLRHLKDLMKIGWLMNYNKTWRMEKNRHVTRMRFYSLRKKGLKYKFRKRDEANSYFATCESVDIPDQSYDTHAWLADKQKKAPPTIPAITNVSVSYAS